MEISFVRVKKQEADLFRGLDPFEKLHLLTFPGFFSIAALTPDEEGNPIPSGLMIAQIIDENLDIHWIGAASAIHGMNIGEKLLVKAFEIADKRDMTRLRALISSELFIQRLGETGSLFFGERLFEREISLTPEYVGSISGLRSLSFFKKVSERLPKPELYSSLPASVFKTLPKQLDDISDAVKLFKMSSAGDHFDKDISFVFVDEGEVYGALLIRRAGEFLVPVYFYAESEDEAAALILNTVSAAEEKYGPDMDVWILPVEAKHSPYIDMFFENESTEGCMMIAEVEDYSKMKDSLG